MEQIKERLDTDSPEDYIKDILDQHLEVLEKTVQGTLDDPNRRHLFHLFLAKLGPEKARNAVERATRYEEEGGRQQTEKIFWEEWKKMGYTARLCWARVLEKWKAPLYDGQTFGSLAARYMSSVTNVDFSAKSGLSYGVVTRTVIHKLRGAGIERVQYLFEFSFAV